MAVGNLERHEDGQKQAKQADKKSAEVVWAAHLFRFLAFQFRLGDERTSRHIPE